MPGTQVHLPTHQNRESDEEDREHPGKNLLDHHDRRVPEERCEELSAGDQDDDQDLEPGIAGNRPAPGLDQGQQSDNGQRHTGPLEAEDGEPVEKCDDAAAVDTKRRAIDGEGRGAGPGALKAGKPHEEECQVAEEDDQNALEKVQPDRDDDGAVDDIEDIGIGPEPHEEEVARLPVAFLGRDEVDATLLDFANLGCLDGGAHSVPPLVSPRIHNNLNPPGLAGWYPVYWPHYAGGSTRLSTGVGGFGGPDAGVVHACLAFAPV